MRNIIIIIHLLIFNLSSSESITSQWISPNNNNNNNNLLMNPTMEVINNNPSLQDIQPINSSTVLPNQRNLFENPKLSYERQPHEHILKCLSENPQTSELFKLLQTKEFESINQLLSMNTPNQQITLFAPSNDAMKQLTSLNRLTPVPISNVLLYHMIPGLVPGHLIQSLHFAPTLYKVRGRVQGMKLARTYQGQIQASSGPTPPATLINPDLASNNGLVHVIDRILLPPPTVTDTLKLANLTHFLEIVTQNDLIVTMERNLGGTVFAPTNEALERLARQYPKLINDHEALYNLAKAHFAPQQVRFSTRINKLEPSILQTLSGKIAFTKGENGLSVNNVKVSQADLITRFGVLHIIDGIINTDNEGNTNNNNNNNDKNSNDNLIEIPSSINNNGRVTREAIPII